MSLMRVAAANGMVLTYDTDDETDTALTPEQRRIRSEAARMLPADVVHWRGLDAQRVFIPLSQVARPTRCGLFGHARLAYPLRYVTCPKCRELAEADGVPALIEQTRADVAAAFGIPESLQEAQLRQIDEQRRDGYPRGPRRSRLSAARRDHPHVRPVAAVDARRLPAEGELTWIYSMAS